VQFGAVISKGLFGEIAPVGMVFLRLVTSSLILLGFFAAAAARPAGHGLAAGAGARRARRDELGFLRVVRPHPARCGGHHRVRGSAVSIAATGRRWAGVEGLAAASTIATLAIAPFAVVAAGDRLLEPRLLVLGALVGLLSSVVPYSLEMVALRTLPPRVFGILMSLEPAAAALAAAVLLSEWLTPLQLLAMACVTAASVGAARTESAPEALPRD